MPLILGTNSIKDTGYEVANSCRFNDGDNPSLKKTPSGAGSLTNWTFSCWVKRSTVSNAQQMIAMALASSGNDTQINFSSGDQIEFFNRSGGSVNGMLLTNRKFRDVSAWYHIVAVWNSDDGTAGNRMRLYINGTEETSFATDTNPSADTESKFNSACEHCIGQANSGSADFDGYMAEVCFIDGQALTPTSFGEFDEDSPTIWKPIDVSGLTFGSNGTYLDFEDSDNLGDDESGNTNDWTEANLAATDQATDTPTNNFATMNPLNVPTSNAPAFAEGNLETESATTTGQRFMGSSTIGVTAAKWYVECRVKVIDSLTVGVSPDVAVHAKDNTYVGSHAHDWSILPQSGNKYNNNSGTTHGDAFSVDDILMIALDLVNNNVYFGHNGNWFDGSGNADEAAPNSALSLTAPASTPEGAYFFACSDGGGSAKAKVHWNFGNPPYANSSSVADANGYGAFEYAPPSGYLALCTKNLGSDGG